MKRVFISYSSHDTDIAMKVVEYLESKGVNCFIANRDIEGGLKFATKLVAELGDCAAVLLVASSAINTSDHVQREIDIAFDKRKPILPVFIEEFVLIDEYKYYIGNKQRIMAYPDSIDMYYAKMLDSLEQYLPKRPIPMEEETQQAQSDNAVIMKNFEYKPSRGVMINPEDGERNVSFRTDTLINLLGGIFEKVAAISDAAAAEEIFYSSGYQSGKNFAERINNKWDSERTVEGMRYKLKKWCEFDSEVGWGYFSAGIEIDEENDCLTGIVSINEAFIVDNKNKRKICSFIRGYCTGVVGTLLDCEVELTCRECPLKSKFKCTCKFDVKSIG